MPKSGAVIPVAELDGRSDDSHAVFLLLGHGASAPAACACTASCHRPYLPSPTRSPARDGVRHLYTPSIVIPSGAPAPVKLHLTGQAFAWTPLTGASVPPCADDAPLLPLWESCWSCGQGGDDAGDVSRPASGGWTCEWTDVLGAEVTRSQAASGSHLVVVHFVDRHPRYGRDQHSWHVGAERFVAPDEGAAQSVVDAIRATLRGPAFSNRPRKLLVRGSLADGTDGASGCAVSLTHHDSTHSPFPPPCPFQVIISPTAGKGRGRDTWTQVAAPVLASAGIQVRVVYTSRKGDAFDVAAALVAPPRGAAAVGAAAVPGAQPPRGAHSPQTKGGFGGGGQSASTAAAAARVPHASELDGVLVVGGDGTFNEVLNGIMQRPEVGLATTLRLRFGVIPAGSTDAVACTLHGTRCPRTAAAHAALGGSQRMDALRVDASDGTTRYASNFAGLGFFGRVIQLSEHMRWMGPMRYGAAGALAFTQHAAWNGTLEYLPINADEASAIAQAPPAPPTPGKGTPNGKHLSGVGREGEANGGGLPNTGSATAPLRRRRLDSMSPVGMGGRPVWEDDGPSSTGSAHSVASDAPESGGIDHASGEATKGGLSSIGLASPRPLEGSHSQRLAAASPRQQKPDLLLADVAHHGVMPPPPATLSSGAKRSLGSAVSMAAPVPGAPAPLAGWKAITGAWHVVAGASISCRNDAAPAGIAPRAVLCDGAVDVLAVRSCSRLSYLHHLVRLARPELGDHLSMPFVLSVKARAFRFTPSHLGGQGGAGSLPMWNVDGELLPQTMGPTRVTVLPGLLTMFAFVPDDA